MLSYGGALLLWLLISTAAGGEVIKACAGIIDGMQVKLEGLLEATAAELSGTGRFEVDTSNIMEAIRVV